MKELLQGIATAMEKADPQSYGSWGTRYAGYFALVGTGLSTMIGGMMGGWDGPVKALIFFMAADLVSGIAAACKEKQVDSQVMLWGGVGKVLILLLVAAGVVLDSLLGLAEPYCRLAVIWFYIGREGLSILENYGRMGLPLPEFLGDLLRQVQKRSEKSSER